MSDPRIEAAALEDAADIIWMRANSESGACDADRRTDSYRVAEGVAREVIGAYRAAADKAATITEAHVLAEVPIGTVVRSAAGTIAARFDGYTGVVFGDERGFPWRDLALPATIIHWGQA